VETVVAVYGAVELWLVTWSDAHDVLEQAGCCGVVESVCAGQQVEVVYYRGDSAVEL
jgi:hypothetical protein